MKFPKISFISAGITILILLSLGIYSRTFSIQKVDLPRKSLKDFPTRIGDYESRDLKITQGEMSVLDPTEVLIRSYVNSKNELISLYIPFFEAQNDRSRIHSPKSCMVGGGYRFVKIKPFPLKYKGRTVKVNWVLTQRGTDRQVVLYWIQSRGRIMTSEYISKLYLMWDQFARHRSDCALFRCIAQARKGDTLDQTTRRVARFAQMVMDLTPDYLPE